jgi:hypothetical protein
MLFYWCIILALINLRILTAKKCQDSAMDHLNTLISEKRFGWCEINQDLEGLVSWFSDSESFSKSQWLDPTAWSPFQINHGQTVIFTTHMISFIVMSVIANALVLFYHFSHSAHPKFSFSTSTQIYLKIHIYSGTVGVLLPLYVFFTTNQHHGFICMLACVIMDYVFAYTAFRQAPNVYGVRNLTVPLYYTCITLKFILATCLLQSLFYEPIGGYKTKVLWLWLCWVLHQTYAWVRVWYSFFILTDTMANHRYTVSVMLSGFMCINYSVGFSAVLLMIIFISVHFLVLHERTKMIVKEAEDDFVSNGSVNAAILTKSEILSSMWDETHLDVFTNRPEASRRALKLFAELGVDPMDEKVESKIPDIVKAQFLFQSIDADGSGSIIPNTLEKFFMEFGVRDVAKAAMSMFDIADEDKNGTIELEEFTKHFRAFYVYAFDDLMKSIRNVNRHSYRNKLHEIANKQHRLKIDAIRQCPFMSFRDDVKPTSSNVSDMNTYPSSASLVTGSDKENRFSFSFMEELVGIEIVSEPTSPIYSPSSVGEGSPSKLRLNRQSF